MKKYVDILKEYYGTNENKQLFRLIFHDLLVSFFLRSGSGLLSSIVKGVVSRFFINSKSPLFVGKRTRFVNVSNITLGGLVRIKDDVSIIAHGSIVVGSDVSIGEKTTLWSYKNKLIIGDSVTIGRNCYIAQLGGSIRIGNNVLIGDDVKMYSKNHVFDNVDIVINKQGYRDTKLIISNNVWIGSGVIVFNNVTVGEGSIIGANSVVRENVPSYTVFGGVPGKILTHIYPKVKK